MGASMLTVRFRRLAFLASGASALAFAGCADGNPSGPDAGEVCSTDLDCDDGFECTIDSCGVNMLCRHDGVDERCEAGETCEAGRGCVTTSSCSSDADCDDEVECTLDSCGVGGICNNMALDERCSEPTPVCDAAMGGCVAPGGCGSDAECDDDVECTRDSCTVDRECRNMPLDELCDSAAGEVCTAERGCLVPMPCDTAADCQDGDFCNGAEVCDPEFGCAPAEEPRMCDDSDDCTIDSCDATADMCVFACDTSRSECDCPVTGPSCEGTFDLSPAIVDSCAGGMVNYDMSQVTFEITAGILEATPTRAHFTKLSDTMEPVCPNFIATAVVSGGTTERFTLQGTFSDDDNFTGSFTADYGGLGSLVGCREGTFSVTGARSP